ncbi:DUF3515 family protein [Brachybacterium sp. GCM10030267]|uniref:DUF3515 family protein n=1 Tax=unclassified Brachybacterium TaxID=2623841 RepID=UPI003619D05F
MLRTRLPALAAAGLLTLGAASCGTVQVPPGPAATDPVCADIIVGAPPQVLGMDRTETSSQGTAAWGSGEDTVVMRCGVTPPGPTTDICTTLEDGSGVQIDWIVRELEGDMFLYTTYGREPAIDISVPRSAAGDQPSAAALDLAQVISRNIEATDYCVGPGEEA